jgi:DNA repair exonuclease SbcCD ATPase subunit
MEPKPVAIRYADEVEAHNLTKTALTAAQSDVAARIKAMDEKDEEIKRLQDENEELKKKLQEYEDQDKEKDAKHADEVAQLSAKVGELTGKLALSPAHADVTPGVAPVPASTPASDSLTKAQHWDRYAKISDPIEKAKYFKANRIEMEKK